MKKLLYLLSALFVVSCGGGGDNRDDENQDIDIFITKSSLTLEAIEDNGELEVNATGSWTAKITPTAASEWLTVTPSSGGSGKTAVVVSAGMNRTEERKAFVTFVNSMNEGKTLNITQKSNVSISLSHSSLLFPFQASAKTVEVTAGTDWTSHIEYGPGSGEGWITLGKTSGTAGKTDLTIQTSAATRKRTATIVLNIWDYKQKIEVVQDNYYSDKQVVALQTATQGQGIDLIFMGEGYVREDLMAGTGNYEKHIKEGVESFFDIEPYKTYRNRFNVWMVAAESAERGVSNEVSGKKVNSCFSLDYNERLTPSNGMTGYNKILDYGRLIPDPPANKDLVIVMVANSTKYGGVCPFWQNGPAIAIVPRSQQSYPSGFKSILQHEAGGHGFGRLGDEYGSSGTATQAQINGLREGTHANGYYHNLDGKSDPNMSLDEFRKQVKWKDFIGHPKYPNVDVFEGGNEKLYGFWRSEQGNTLMRNNYDNHTAIGRWRIVRRIMELSEGTDVTFEQFVDQDNTWRSAASAAFSSGRSVEFVPSHTPPVCLGVWRE